MVPIVRDFFDMARDDLITNTTIAEKAGTTAKSITDWKCGHATPRLDLFLAAVEAAGYRLTLERR